MINFEIWCLFVWKMALKMGSSYAFLFVVVCYFTLATAGIMGDECDWTGSGLKAGSSREVTPVYLRCRTGKITWLYPQGALRVILHLQNSNRDFKVCIKVLSTDDDTRYDQEPDLYSDDRVLDFREEEKKSYEYKLRGVKEKWKKDEEDYLDEEDRVATVSYTTESIESYMRKLKNKNKKKDFPARLFLEGSRGLLPFYSADDGHAKEVRCFRSKGGQAAIYVEADPVPTGGVAPKRAVRLQYDLQTVPVHSYDPAAEECRPCTDQEMANAFCTSDLVTRGIIVGMQDRDDLDTSELTIKITKLIRYSSPGGRTFQVDPEAPMNASSRNSWMGTLFVDTTEVIENQIVSSRDVERKRRRRRIREETWYARVHVSAKCGVTPGPGEFLITAKRKLGSLSLACAPRIEDWTAISREVNEKETAQCLLTS